MTTFDLSLSRIYKCDAKTLFQAIGEGMLFKFTGADMQKSKVDFREGGKFSMEWPKAHSCLEGEFRNIVPYSKIVFTWPTVGKDTNEPIATLVTITIKENDGRSILTLKHEGFDGFTSLNEHDFGWDDAMSDLRKFFREAVAKIENNKTGLDLYFKLKKTIHSPRAKVFAAVAEAKQLNQYFNANQKGDFIAGAKVEWNFSDYPQMFLHVNQTITNEMISFKWGETTVCLSFRDKGPQETEVVVEATGWKADQSGLDNSYSECEGWQNFLDRLAYFTQGKL